MSIFIIQKRKSTSSLHRKLQFLNFVIPYSPFVTRYLHSLIAFDANNLLFPYNKDISYDIFHFAHVVFHGGRMVLQTLTHCHNYVTLVNILA